MTMNQSQGIRSLRNPINPESLPFLKKGIIMARTAGSLKPNSKAGRIRAAFEKLGWDKENKEIKAYVTAQGKNVENQDIAQVRYQHQHSYPKNVSYQGRVTDKNGNIEVLRGHRRMMAAQLIPDAIRKPELTIAQLKKVKLLKDRLGSFTQSKEVFNLIDELGGLIQARQALDALEFLTK
jgi:hypothetical protein